MSGVGQGFVNLRRVLGIVVGWAQVFVPTRISSVGTKTVPTLHLL